MDRRAAEARWSGPFARRRLRYSAFRKLRAEDLPAELGSFRLITFGASCHRTDRDRVAKPERDSALKVRELRGAD
jgi:hypothetical protein